MQLLPYKQQFLSVYWASQDKFLSSKWTIQPLHTLHSQTIRSFTFFFVARDP